MILNEHRIGGRSAARRGTILSLLALTIVGLVAFLGLAIDLGMLAIAKTQAQDAADLAALTAARTLNGNPTGTYNQAAATTNAQNILTYNYILSQGIQSSQLALTYGSYDYNQTTQTFNANYPPTSGVPTTAVTATVTSNSLPGAFSKIFGSSLLPNVSATAQAVHRPRDIGLVMDLSGSMRFGTCLGFDFFTNSRTTNNPDSVVPTFGQYSGGNAATYLQGPTTNSTSSDDNYTISPSNTTVSNTSYTRTYINNFYQNAAYAGTLVRAFDSYTSTDNGNTWTAPSSGGPLLPPASYTTVPGGDRPLFFWGSATNYAQEVEDAVNGTNRKPWWELDGYSGCTNGAFNNADLGTTSYPGNSSSTSALNGTGNSVAGAFSGYTKGPGYYGKTFFIWPPDPRRPLDTGNNTSWSSTANDTIAIKQFLTDFGYTAADFNNTAVATTLTSAITNATTTINVANYSSAPSFPAVPFRIVVGTEVMIVTAVAGGGNKTWTVQGGKDGTTTAATAASGATVGLATGPPLSGIFSVTTQTGSQNWPWPSGDNALGTVAGTLSNYLVTNVYKPGPSNAKLTTADAAFKLIMRLYNWDYVIDNIGTPCDWRIRFFGTNDNTAIFNGSGSINPPGSSGMWPGLSSSAAAIQTYNEILRWINQSTDPFPTQLRAGRVKYYGTAINPTASTTVKWNPTYTNGITRLLPELGQHRPTLLGRVHQLHARLLPNGCQQLPGHQRHGGLRQRFHLGDPAKDFAAHLGRSRHGIANNNAKRVHELPGQPRPAGAAPLVQPHYHGRLSPELQHGRTDRQLFLHAARR